MKRNIIAALGLVALWLLMSGLYKPLILGLGFCSVLLAVYISNRMDQADNNTPLAYPIGILATLKYLFWLMGEIVKSNIAVSKIILSPKPGNKQNLFKVPVSCKSEIGQVVFANSITLTPGTITVETEDDYFIVHALDSGPSDLDELGEMDRQVRAIETGVVT